MPDKQWLAITLKTMTAEVNNIDYITCGWVEYIKQQVNSQFLYLMHWKQEKMGKRIDHFD